MAAPGLRNSVEIGARLRYSSLHTDAAATPSAHPTRRTIACAVSLGFLLGCAAAAFSASASPIRAGSALQSDAHVQGEMVPECSVDADCTGFLWPSPPYYCAIRAF